MSYANIESALKTCLQSVTALASTVTQGDYAVLDKGVTDAAVLYPGSVSTSAMAGWQVDVTHDCHIDLFKRFTDEATAHSEFVTLRDNVIAKILDAYPDWQNPSTPAATGPYQILGITADGDPQDVRMNVTGVQTGPVFRAQTLTVSIQETLIIT